MGGRIAISILFGLLVLGCTPQEQPQEKDPGTDPVLYANEFNVRCVLPGRTWTKDDVLTLIDSSTGAEAGMADLVSGAGKETAMMAIHTDLKEGDRVRLVHGNKVPSACLRQICSESDAFPQKPVFSSDAFALSARPGQVDLAPACAYLRIDCNGSCPDSVKVAGVTLVPDKTHPSVLWAAVDPAGKISVTQYPAKNTTQLPERALAAGETYRISLQCGAVIPADKTKTESTYETDKYKKKADDQNYSTVKSLTVDGMNWMPKLCVPTHDRWGGYEGVKPDEIVSANPAGFWRTGKYKGRWVMVDPDGNVAILHGVNGAAPDPEKEATTGRTQELFKKHFQSNTEWALYANNIMAGYGFNFFSMNPKRIRLTRDYFSAADQTVERTATSGVNLSEVAFCYILRTFSWDYYSLTGKSIDTGKWSVFALMFDDRFPDYVDALAADAAALYKDDRDFIGYYTDNELQFRAASASTPGIYLKQWLSYDLTDPLVLPAVKNAKAYAENWMKTNYNVDPDPAKVTTAMENAFLLHISDCYYKTVTEAIRRHDPNHLLLGSRLHGKPKQLQQVHEACAKYNDIVSVNVYGVWEPNDSYFITQYKSWVEKTPKPCFVTEFYTRAADSSFEGEKYANAGEGGGWIVPDEPTRGHHYQNFTRKLISYDHCIGWQWFQFTDDWREANGWNGKGLVNPGYEPYRETLSSMKQLHLNIYQILDYYHNPAGARSDYSGNAALASWEY